METLNPSQETYGKSQKGQGARTGPAICHISVLNPTTHTRIFYKLALSQQTYGCRVSIIAQDKARTPYAHQGIQLIPLPPFGRLSWKRFFLLPFWLLRRIRAHPAQVYWLHTPELMWLGWILKLSGKQVVYDAHEDYFKTLYFAQHYPRWFRIPLAYLLRFLEKRWGKRLDAVVYAETCYDNMLGSPSERTVILRNTFTPRSLPSSSLEDFSVPSYNYLLYTGTLAKEWGLFRTIELWRQLNERRPLHLVVAGFTHSSTILQKVESLVDQSGLRDRFTLIGGQTYVPYPHIIRLIQHCYVGTALYEVSPVIAGKIPTKFFEFMAFDKALIYSLDPAWESFDRQHQLGVAWKPGKPALEVWEEIHGWKAHHPPSSYSWEADEKTLFALLDKLS